MKIQILGPGCKRTQKLAENVNAALRELGQKVRAETVADPETISKMGALSTPALAVDGKVMVTGRVLSVREVKKLLERATA